MKLFESTFGFQDVLNIRPGKGEAVKHALTGWAWRSWQQAQPAAFEQHEENAYVTIDVALPRPADDSYSCGYVITIQVQAASINLQKARELYIAMKGIRCPACKSDELEGGHIEANDGGATQEITCGNCGSTWTDVHSLVRIDDLIVREGRE